MRSVRLRHSAVYFITSSRQAVVLLDTYLASNVLLGDAELLFHAKLDRKSVRIPTCAAVDFVAGLRLVTADGILDGTCHHVMDAGHSVCARRAFEKYKLRGTLAQFERLFECMVALPTAENFIRDRHQIKALVLFECHIFCKFAL